MVCIQILIAIVFGLKTVQMSKMCQTMYRLDTKDVKQNIKVLGKQKKFIEKLLLGSSKDTKRHSTPSKTSVRSINKLFMLQESVED